MIVNKALAEVIGTFTLVFIGCGAAVVAGEHIGFTGISFAFGLGLIAMAYGNVYVAQIALGANPKQTLKTFLEAEAWDGPSIIIAYSQCIAHGIDMSTGMTHQKEAVNSGYWPLYRFDPGHTATDHLPFQLDSKKPKIPFADFANKEARFAMLSRIDPEAHAQFLLVRLDVDVARARAYPIGDEEVDELDDRRLLPERNQL